MIGYWPKLLISDSRGIPGVGTEGFPGVEISGIPGVDMDGLPWKGSWNMLFMSLSFIGVGCGFMTEGWAY